MKKLPLFARLLGCVLLFGPLEHLSAKEVPQVDLPSYQDWDEETVALFENLLVQEGGRIKPISTQARFALIQFVGRSKISFATEDGVEHNVGHAAWMLDALYRGDIAKHIPIFVVDDSDVIVQIGVSPKAKRDRYTYNELFPGRARLAELGSQYAEQKQKADAKKDDPTLELDQVETMVMNLARNVSSFEYLLGQFSFARGGKLLVNENILPAELLEVAGKLDPVEMLDKMPEMSLEQLFAAVQQGGGTTEDERLFSSALRLFFFHANSGRGVALFPPATAESEVWLSSGDVLLAALADKSLRPWATERLTALKATVTAVEEGPEAFQSALEPLVAGIAETAAARGEATYAGLELKLYHGKYFANSLALFIVGFVLLAISWLAPGNLFGKIFLGLAILCAVLGVAYDIYGIALRCIIRQRPPITNLYDTVLFITAVAVLLGLALEYFTRIGVGAIVALVSGVLGMFLSIKYEAHEATDTMGQLVAVLDTNFWLWTHVTIINIGYAAGLVAAILGLIYLGTRFVLMIRQKEAKDFLRVLTRMNYGIICFCLFFSLVGTVLGGIWANYSWGRFWGWDPKENGALMICLWTLVILHGRMAGWIREIGIHMNAIILGMIVTFSWWGVNNLGVGLHSYGFTQGVWHMLFTLWGAMGIFMALGAVVWFVERFGGRSSLEANPSGSKAVPAEG
jgi:ABC-type transport system involved in cytochrome c biogenesis permease subunit